MQSNNRITRRQRTFSTLCGVLTSASLLLTSVAAAPIPRSAQTVLPTDPQAVPTETAAPSPAQTPTAAPAGEAARVNFHQIIIKFKAGTSVQANSAGLGSIQQSLPNLSLKPLFPQAEQVLPENRVSALATSGSYSPGLDRYVLADLGPDVTFADAEKVLTEIQQDPSVQVAYMEPIYLPASPLNVPPGDLTGSQGYLENSGNGIHAKYAWTIQGGRGDKIQLIDIEAGWQIGHEDLNISADSIIEGGNSSDQQWISHGTAVLGVVAARLNTFGVTGIAPSTFVRMINTLSVLPSQAILDATLNLKAGDILLIPTQMLGPRTNGIVLPPDCDPTGFESLPIEYTLANYDAIYAATLKGIIVVEAAGNGAVNLDDALYANLFNRSNRDSGAILVGAGDSITREPTCNTNYGKRIDVQGWGNNVATTGINPITGVGDLYQGEDAEGNPDPNEAYTNSFGGSSAAAAMVAGAAASLQGVATNRGYILSPSQVRSILRSTGTAQGGDAAVKPIGPLPNLEEAFNKKLTQGVKMLTPADGSGIRILRPTLVWQSFLDATQYEVQISKGDSNFGNFIKDVATTSTEYTLPTNLVNATYFWRVRPMVNGVWLDWPTADAFQFTVYGSGSPAVTPLNPINGLATSDYTPTFRWKLPSSTTPPPDGYELVISKNYDFSNSLPTITINDGSTFTVDLIDALEQNSRYYWRIRSFFTGGAGNDYSVWSPRFTLYTRLNITGLNPVVLPAPDLYADTLRPTFDWNDITDAKKYEINIAAVQNFSTIYMKAELKIPSGETIPTSIFRPGSDLPRNKIMYWRVRAFGDFTWSDWSPTTTVYPAPGLSPTPPGVPAPVLPVNLKPYGLWEAGIHLTWKRPSTLLPPAISYQVQVATAKTFTGDDLLFTEDALETGDPTILPGYDLSGLQSESIYYWRVRSVGETGVSAWSAINTFYTTPPIPTGTDIIDGLSQRPTFTWDKSSDDRSYQVQVARDSDAIDDKTKLFSGTRLLATMTTLNSPPFTSTTTLPRRASLYWRVRAGGLYGYSGWSDPVQFETLNPPNAPILKSPDNGSVLGNFSPTLDWYDSVKIPGNPESNAVGYELQIAKGLSNLKDADIIPVEKSFYVIPFNFLTSAGTYYWRVRAINGESNSIWSATYSFTTPAMVSGTISDIINDPDGTTGLAGVTIQIDGLAIQVITGPDGTYQMRGLLPGSYTLTASVPGYGRQKISFSVGNGSNLTRNFRLVPLPDTETQYRIILYWNGVPTNLDAHLFLPPVAGNAYNLYDATDHRGDLAEIGAELTVGDSITGYGPEVITIDRFIGGKYTYAVYLDDSDLSKFATSQARVYVYQGSTQKATFSVSSATDSGSGHWWKVFSIDGVSKKITALNTINDIQPGP